MDLKPLMESIMGRLGDVLPNLLAALAILILGWFVALLVRAGVRRAADALQVNERLRSAPDSFDFELGISSGAYYLVLLLVLLAFFDALQLQLVSAPLQSLIDQFFGFAPNLVAGGALIFIAVLLASLLRGAARSALQATNLDERLSEQAGMSRVSESLATVLYWVVILLFLPAILGALEVKGLLAPVEGMVNKALAMLPNVLAAGAIGVVGWLVARIVRDLVSNLLSAAGADRIGESAGLRGTMTMSRLLGLIVYVLILIPAITAALNALQIEAITGPATQMLAALLGAVPDVFAAVIILGLTYLVARFFAGLVSEILAGAGLNQLPERIGLAQAFSEERTPAMLAGTLIVFFAMLFATVEAAARIGFTQVSDLVTTFIAFGAQVLLGTAIIAIGFWLSNLVMDTIRRVYGDEGELLGNVARFAILGLVLAMGLRAMGLADDIVNLAFGLILGAAAVAVALSFGLGGREAAGRQMEHWLGQLRGEGAARSGSRTRSRTRSRS